MSFRKLIRRLNSSSSGPSGSLDNPSETTFWRPVFDPSHPVSQEWDHKLGHGDNGWGNNELQNYTANPDNSF